ncbi:hypothetical protein C8A05DRAFT_33396 [Staphylotrichum tortipilum]|uniref:Response regulatory domain-containing protein n=1 Tax=Staphylotrichum tortipilum TaxID=2831512 RepID=A0AAN6MM03_9PEZI|nr:hypothetical protein C8A05DRAFT_33396 [Staphylotrichum longicolle]
MAPSDSALPRGNKHGNPPVPKRPKTTRPPLVNGSHTPEQLPLAASLHPMILFAVNSNRTMTLLDGNPPLHCRVGRATPSDPKWYLGKTIDKVFAQIDPGLPPAPPLLDQLIDVLEGRPVLGPLEHKISKLVSKARSAAPVVNPTQTAIHDALAQFKSRMLATMWSEIRTPFQGLSRMVDMLLRASGLPPGHRATVLDIDHSVKALMSLVGVRLASPRADREMTPGLATAAEAKGLAFNFDVPHGPNPKSNPGNASGSNQRVLPDTTSFDVTKSTGAVLPISERGAMLILVVEDNATIRHSTGVALQKMGFMVTIVCSAVEATDYLVAAQHGTQEKPRAILMDMQMPVIDGYTCVRLLRFDSQLLKPFLDDVPIIAHSTSASPAELERCSHLGVDGLMTKQGTIQALESGLVWCITKGRQNRLVPANSPGVDASQIGGDTTADANASGDIPELLGNFDFMLPPEEEMALANVNCVFGDGDADGGCKGGDEVPWWRMQFPNGEWANGGGPGD